MTTAIAFRQSAESTFHLARRDNRDNEVVALPIIPHESFGGDCCGCLYIVAGTEPEYHCNECGAIISAGDVHRVVMEMPSVEETCPHCGRVNQIDGFLQVFAFVCRHCGQGVNLTPP